MAYIIIWGLSRPSNWCWWGRDYPIGKLQAVPDFGRIDSVARVQTKSAKKCNVDISAKWGTPSKAHVLNCCGSSVNFFQVTRNKTAGCESKISLSIKLQVNSNHCKLNIFVVLGLSTLLNYTYKSMLLIKRNSRAKSTVERSSGCETVESKTLGPYSLTGTLHLLKEIAMSKSIRREKKVVQWIVHLCRQVTLSRVSSYQRFT